MNEAVKVQEYVYKETQGCSLHLKVYSPEGEQGALRPVVVFFFGGGWVRGTIDHFQPQSEFIAEQGMIAITPDYRVFSRHRTTPFECVEDARDAISWVSRHAEELGTDRERIAVGGGSAGGHLALCTVLLPPEVGQGPDVSGVPKAMVLFNPVCDTTDKGFRYESLGSRMLELSPLHHIREGLPPALLFHGTADRTVPFRCASDFRARMLACGNECELIAYEGRGHGFFNPGRSEGEADHEDTKRNAVKFLKRIFG
ncbi:alpha/beta hydrolase [Paenibacillus hemerocallicola]|uniref:Alpha/beta hydrolase n=1 Tax=Paenibacillus hemerocallicola TaxID=1172614 RepID=A0A5C4TBW1_9BACL|nr:alpha/beta hydrolase [Paenibacillus hemerocallicola]TNJ66090.1 alpha/beta hydrolase [Paenibacillus hemerocallicola]